MKSLKDTINESLVYEKRFTPEEKSEREAILNFIQENYRASKNGLKLRKEGDKWIVDFTQGRIDVVNKNITSLTNGLFEWGDTPSAWFDCSDCKNLTSLEGSPRVCSVLDISGCSKLLDLEGCSAFHKLFCRDCDSLTSFKGINPLYNDADIWATNCKNLKSLEGLPSDKIGKLYLDDCKSLTSFKYCPKQCYILSIAGCSNIKSWVGAPKYITIALFYGGCPHLKDQEPPCEFSNSGKAYYGYNGTTGASMIGR